jgi:hypothetical protein
MSEEDKPKKEVYEPSGTLNNLVFESVFNNSEPKFLVYDSDHGFTTKEDFKVGNERALPLRRDDIPYEPYTVDKETLKTLTAEDCNAGQLFLEVLAEYKQFLDVPEPYLWLEAIQTLETYQQQKLQTVGYLAHIGDANSGKSRALELQYYLAYRPLYTLDPSAPNVYRYLGCHGQGRGTILQDEAHDLKYNRELLSIYCMGYRAASKYPRIVKTSEGELLQRYYNVFGCKCFAGLYLPNYEPFRQRCIVVPMAKGDPEKDEIISEDKERFGRLKLRLLAWKMISSREPLPVIDTVLKGRQKELWKGKLQLSSLAIPNPNNPVVKLATEDTTRKIETIKASLEAQLCRAVVLACNEEEGFAVPFAIIWVSLAKVLEGEISKPEGKAERISTPNFDFPITANRIGGMLSSVFDAQKHLLKGIGRVWSFDKTVLQKLAKKYFVEETLKCEQQTLA